MLLDDNLVGTCFCFKQKTAYEMRISDWSSDVCSSDLSASRTWALERANLRPPFRPRARAAARPAMVRSRIISRSNSASVAKMPNTIRPDGVVVSICAPLPVSTRRPIPRSDRFCTVLTRWVSVRPSRSSFQTMRRSEEHTSELQSLMRISYAVFCLKQKILRTLHTSTKHTYHKHIL